MTIDLPASLPGKLRYFHYWIATWFVCSSYFQFSRRDGVGYGSDHPEPHRFPSG